jgi:glycosyltransferase involved in cell wall biosynthesis
MERPRAIILASWHPVNAALCMMARRIAGTRTAVWLHEPYKEDKAAYGMKAVVFVAVEMLQSLAMSWIDDVIVHSEMALAAFRRRYPRATQGVHLIPLKFQDCPVIETERCMYSFLGRAAKAKGIDMFFEVVEAGAGRIPARHFGIATCDDISCLLEKLSPAARSTLHVVSNPSLPDSNLRRMASASKGVLCLYASSMQSGVVPMAFMCGAPVIVTNVPGLTEAVVDGQTGCILPPNATVDDVLQAIDCVDRDFTMLSNNCRREFLRKYHDNNWSNDYAWLFNGS